MKISFATLILCVILCQAKAGYRGNADMGYPRSGVVGDDTDLSHMHSNNDVNMARYQSSVFTGRVSVQVEEVMSFILEKLQALKDMFDRLGWTTLAELTNKIIDYFNRFENKVPPSTDGGSYSRRFLTSPPVPRPCEPLDTRPQCAIVGYGR